MKRRKTGYCELECLQAIENKKKTDLSIRLHEDRHHGCCDKARKLPLTFFSHAPL